MRDRFIPYPLQNNLHRLPARDLYRCLDGLVDIITQSPRQTPANFREWILSTYGQGIADIFMLPYNLKVWAHDPSVMNASWVGDRVAPTDLRRVLKNLVFQTDDRAWGPNHTFRFPKQGGTGAIWKACAARLPVERQVYNTDSDLARSSKTNGANLGWVDVDV